MKNKSHKYSKLILTPKDKDERARFWDFRVEDISGTLPYFVMFYVIIWISYLFAYFMGPTNVTLINLLLSKVMLALWVATYFARKRFKRHYIYMIIVLFICSQT